MTDRPTDFSDEDAKQAIEASSTRNLRHITSPQEKLFAREMALTGDLSRSYRLAYSQECTHLKPSQIRLKAARLLTRARVDEIYQYYKEAVSARMDIREERILRELACIAFSDPAELYADDGVNFKNIHEIPAHVRASISKFKTGYTKDGIITDLQLNDKMKALQMLVNIKNMDAENKAAKAPTIRIALGNSSDVD
jgi:hypothetical protein